MKLPRGYVVIIGPGNDSISASDLLERGYTTDVLHDRAVKETHNLRLWNLERICSSIDFRIELGLCTYPLDFFGLSQAAGF